MDILYISPKTKTELTQYCDSDLLTEVFEHFAKTRKVVAKDNERHPSRWWVITDYISDKTIDTRKKLSVILSFAAIGGFVQIGDKMECGDVSVLNMLKGTNNISNEDFEYFIEAFFDFSCGKGVKFS